MGKKTSQVWCVPVTPALGVKAGGLGSEGHPLLKNESEVSLYYVRPGGGEK